MTLALASFLGVFLKSCQQLNVTGYRWRWVPLFSYGMAFCDVYVLGTVLTYGVDLYTVMYLGTGGALGCWAGMWLHRHGSDYVGGLWRSLRSVRNS